MSGDFSNKLLHFPSSKSKNSHKQPMKKAAGAENHPIVDITFRRQQIIAEERRRVKRTILTEFVGACLVIPQRGLVKVALHDISDNGVSFDLEAQFGQLMVGDEVAMRVYLNNKTYFPFTVRVTNARDMEREPVYRHGASFVKGTINDTALHHFVKFIESVSSCLQTDHGDILVPNNNTKA